MPPASCKTTSNCTASLKAQPVLLVWKQTVSDPAGRLSSWVGPDPCSLTQPWAGVQCSDDRFAIMGLNVSGFGLSGSLPPVQEIAELTVSNEVVCTSRLCLRWPGHCAAS